VAIYPQAILAMGESEEEIAQATYGVRALLAFYGSTPAYRSVLEVEGWGHLQPELNALSKTGDVDAMTALVSEEMVEVLAVRGTPEQCADELRRRFGDVGERVCAYFPGHDPGGSAISRLAAALA
jgi:alkanesulfonate monooxygenase SsuD/methylene tetrahydromethanopterin reductase-like flavin-dependent oxidoreductase (luciferase family)